jgi:hypothetical protein
MLHLAVRKVTTGRYMVNASTEKFLSPHAGLHVTLNLFNFA